MNRRPLRLLALAAGACLVAGVVICALQAAAPGPAPRPVVPDAEPPPRAGPVEPEARLRGPFAGHPVFDAEPRVDLHARLSGTAASPEPEDPPAAVPGLPAQAQFVEGLKDIGPFDPPIDRGMFADRPRGP